MGQAFSGPNAFKFFGFTQAATQVLQRSPLLLVACTSLGLLAWYIHYVTNIPYRKPKEVKGAKK
jgi:hypothetical protein